MINIPKPDAAFLDALRKAGLEVDLPAAPAKAKPVKRTTPRRRRQSYTSRTRQAPEVRDAETSTILKAALYLGLILFGFSMISQCQNQARNNGWYSTHK
jgi:hypothetical protein